MRPWFGRIIKIGAETARYKCFLKKNISIHRIYGIIYAVFNLSRQSYSLKPIEYAEFNNAYDVRAASPDKSFYDLDPGQMAALLQHQTDLSDIGFELNQNNIYVIGGYEKISNNSIDLLTYSIRQLFVMNNHAKIEKALKQMAIISSIFN